MEKHDDWHPFGRDRDKDGDAPDPEQLYGGIYDVFVKDITSAVRRVTRTIVEDLSDINIMCWYTDDGDDAALEMCAFHDDGFSGRILVADFIDGCLNSHRRAGEGTIECTSELTALKRLRAQLDEMIDEREKALSADA